MKLIEITPNGDLPDCVENRITLKDLDKRLKTETLEGRLKGGEHCFRDSTLWYGLAMGYTNPYNIFRVHAELALLEKRIEETKHRGINSDQIFEAIKSKQLVFYGVGIGDTEMAFVDWQLKNGQRFIEVTGIDVNRDFLKNFVVALRNRLIEIGDYHTHPSMLYRGYHALFEQIQPQDLEPTAPRRAHICLGNTLGNFDDQDKAIEDFARLSIEGDYLILGVQLDKHLPTLFEKYRNNPLFAEFVLNYIPQKKRGKLRWSYNKEIGLIVAEHEGVEVFRSKKYNPQQLSSLVAKFGYELKTEVIDDDRNSCIQVYEKIK